MAADLQTRCPQCQTLFRLSAEQLEAADGQVRCGQCLAVFDARAHLVSAASEPAPAAAQATRDRQEDFFNQPPPPAPAPTQAAEPPLAAEPPAPPPAEEAAEIEIPDEVLEDSLHIDLDELFAEPGAQPAEQAPDDKLEEETFSEEELFAEAEEETPPGDTEPAPQTTEPAHAEAKDEAPGEEVLFAGAEPEAQPAEVAPPDTGESPLPPQLQTEPARPGSLATFVWSLLVLLTLAALAGQTAYFERNTLARHAQLRPWLEKLCAVARCELPLRRAPQAITLLERDIRSHPEREGALILSATFLNRADFPQPYPSIEVRLKDISDRVVASRRFLPKEYLPAPPKGPLPPQGRGQFEVEVLDPGTEAVGFEFSFH